MADEPFSDDELAAWRAEAERTQPKTAREKLPAGRLTTPRLPDQREAAPPSDRLSDLPFLEAGKTAQLHGKLARDLTRGKLVIDAKLDLHGQTKAAAWPVLVAFVESAAQARARTLLIVTGKGRNPDFAPGALREALPEWLNSARLRPLILSYTHATQEDGGTGAWYVYLRRM